ncbi:MAG: hypothetical protein GXP60_03265 [Epsilonproteobacteria bacterium]|nr:hypothetical protein [Campylobacterota bacterium]
MKNVHNKKTCNDHEALHLLLWHDCIERLDILLLEARHLQTNIIYALRKPELYSYLEWEETRLWPEGDTWNECIKNEGQFDSLVNEIILLYPSPKNIEKELSKLNESEKSKTKKTVIEAVKDAKERHHWHTDQTLSYLSLQKLQILKQNIFKDKMILCRHGINAFFYKKGDNIGSAQSKLLLLRSAILEKIRDYIERIGDHQAHFSKTHDIGLQDHPRPAVERRREQGIYSSYLSTYCKDVGREINLLLDCFDNKPKHKAEWYEPEIIHRWNHDFTSRSKTFINEVAVEDELHRYHFYVNSSYWTPDRPDLQSILVHECGHGFVKARLDNLSESKLSNKDDVFITLIRQIKQCLDIYGVERRLGCKDLQLEIAVDLISATINSTGYLYAIFLEMMGNGSAGLFAWGDDDVYDLSLINHLEGAGGVHVLEYEWYIRLSLICAWLEKIHDVNEQPQSDIQKLDIRLIRSCQFLLTQQLDYLESITPDEQKCGDYLRELLKQMTRCIKSSNALKKAAEWRSDRTRAFSERKDGTKEVHPFPRRSKPLCPWAKVLLLESFRLNIISRNQKNNEELDSYISDVYGLDNISFTKMDLSKIYTDNDHVHNIKLPDLFDHISDISWVRSFLSSLDFVDYLSKEKNGGDFQDLQDQKGEVDFIKKIHTEISLGRESFQLALDFHLDSVESKFSRLADVRRLMREWCKHNNQVPHTELYEKINAWLGNDKDPEDIGCTFIKIHQDELKRCVKKYSVNDLMSLKTLNKYDALYHNRLERLRGAKLQELLDILNVTGNSLEISLVSLKEYLENKDLKEVYMLTRSSTCGAINEYSEKLLGEADGQQKNTKLLGRYDILNIEPVRSISRCKLPVFPNDNETDKFPSFFVRRELAIPIRLKEKSWRLIEKSNSENKTPILAVLSIVLTRRSTRLDFLTRVLKMIKKERARVENPQHLVELGGYFFANDVAFLSEGWGDILFIFFGETKRLNDIFKIQNVFFQEFQVDRTELILTPQCVEYAATEKQPGSDNNQFRVSVHVRLKEDRELSPSNLQFKKEFNEKLSDIEEKNKDKINVAYLYYTLTRTPGRMDYSIRIKIRGEPCEGGGGFCV